MTRERLASLANYTSKCSVSIVLASDGVLSLPIRVTMVALPSNSFCQTNAGTQETDFQLLF